MSDDKQTIENLKRQIEELKAEKTNKISFKVSPKKACSVYGLQRFPVTLYKSQWYQLIEHIDELKHFLKDHDSELENKGEI